MKRKIVFAAAACLVCLAVPAVRAISCTNAPDEGQVRSDSIAPNADGLSAKSECLKDVVYSSADSLRVVQLLRTDTATNAVLTYARAFIGVPYVAHTLEGWEPERLVVNLHELDCTTFVETVCALAMTKRQNSDRFADYCQNLQRLRYRGGKMAGYLSRLHYFTWWFHDNINLGLFSEVRDAKYTTTPMNVDNHYMSQHPDLYEHLKGHQDRIDSIAAEEARFNGPDGTYFPESILNLPRTKLTSIHDGDVIAIVTTKDGLDYSHLGFAVWGKDNRLHLLNASSVYHKVVEDASTLFAYLQKRKTSVGIRLLRLR